MFSIKLADHDVWVGKKNISYFVSDDSHFTLRKEDIQSVFVFGVPKKRMRVFLSTDEIRRSLNRFNKESVLSSFTLVGGITCQMIVPGDSLGKFSNYVVVDLVNDKEYSLDDVLNGLV